MNTFRLLGKEILPIVGGRISQCSTVVDCHLQPGDILIRRYVTEGSLFTETSLGLYFTHVGLYLGDNQIVEAYGRERKSTDSIRTDIFSHSLWAQKDINDWVIIRPKKYGAKFKKIKNDLIQIANDPNYVFGIPRKGLKRALCADLIFDQLLTNNMVSSGNAPKFITPDYLFLITATQPADFQIIGYHVDEEVPQ